MNLVESYIRSAAKERGIDPDQAVAVAQSEGLNKYVGDNGSSFGPFQLHYGGGLGDVFTHTTGLDARDPNTTAQQIDFALDHASRHGWGPWHGWKGDQWAGITKPQNQATDAPADNSGLLDEFYGKQGGQQGAAPAKSGPDPLLDEFYPKTKSQPSAPTQVAGEGAVDTGQHERLVQAQQDTEDASQPSMKEALQKKAANIPISELGMKGVPFIPAMQHEVARLSAEHPYISNAIKGTAVASTVGPAIGAGLLYGGLPIARAAPSFLKGAGLMGGAIAAEKLAQEILGPEAGGAVGHLIHMLVP